MTLIFYKLSSITPQVLSVLKNQEILAINQDPVQGTSISPFRWGINVSILFENIRGSVDVTMTA